MKKELLFNTMDRGETPEQAKNRVKKYIKDFINNIVDADGIIQRQFIGTLQEFNGANI